MSIKHNLTVPRISLGPFLDSVVAKGFLCSTSQNRDCYLGTVSCNVFFSIKWALISVIVELCSAFQTRVITKTKQLFRKISWILWRSPLFQLLFLATRSTKESSFDWFKLLLLCLNNSSQIAKYSGFTVVSSHREKPYVLWCVSTSSSAFQTVGRGQPWRITGKVVWNMLRPVNLDFVSAKLVFEANVQNHCRCKRKPTKSVPPPLNPTLTPNPSSLFIPYSSV